MPNEIISYACASCGKLHGTNKRYLYVTANVIENLDPTTEEPDSEPEQVNVKSEIVCNNKCLADLLSIDGF
jgi:hypothetical protein